MHAQPIAQLEAVKAPRSSRIGWFFRELVLPLLLGLGVGAGALAPCQHGACQEHSPPPVVSRP